MQRFENQMVPYTKLLGLTAILLGATLSPAPASLSSPAAVRQQVGSQAAGPTNCQFFPPVEFRGSTVLWHGPCLASMAHGQGVLRAYKKGASTQFFFGNLEHGELRLGVLEVPDGYLAGQFAQGKLQPGAEADRNVVIDAFRKASAAAKAYSQHLEKIGNNASATFYRKKAEQLAQQMD